MSNENVKVENTEETVESVETVEEHSKALDYSILKAASEINTLNNVRNTTLEAKSQGIIDPESYMDIIDEHIAAYLDRDKDIFQTLPEEEINNIFKDENGEDIELDIEFENPEKVLQFKRDYAELLWTSATTLKALDEEIKNYNEAIEEYKVDIDKVYAEFSGSTDAYYENLKTLYAEAKDDDPKKETYRKMIESFEVFPVLERFYEELASLPHPENAYNDAKHEHLFRKVYDKYVRIINSLGLKSNLSSYNNFEGKFIGEDYEKYGDLFLFLIMRAVTYIPSPQKIIDGLFLARFAIMLQDLYKNSLPENDKEHLINIAKKFIDLVTK